MAVVLKLCRAATEVPLTAASGSGLRHVDWMPQAATPLHGQDPAPVTETMDVIAERSSDDLLAGTVQTLDEMRDWASRYMRDPMEETPVWLHAKMSGETGERRAFVHRITMAWGSPQMDATGFPAQHKAKLRLSIERGPWEPPVKRDLPETASEMTGAAIVYDYTANGAGHNIVGDIPARISVLDIATATDCATVGRLWMGFRSYTKHGDPGDFVEVWECEVDGAALGTDAARAEDATASNTTTESPTDYTKVTITPGTATWAKRLSIELQDITADETENYGDFLWLLRHKLSAADSTWEVQLRFGHTGMDDDDLVRGPIQELSNTSWDYAELGRMSIPLASLHAMPTNLYSDAKDQAFCVQIWARRTSGAANLDLDCLCPVPIDEGWLKSWGFELTPGVAAHWYYSEGPDGTVQCIAWDGDIEAIPCVAYHNFRLPKDDGRMIIVFAAASSDDIANGIRLGSGGQYYERWLNLRGAE